MVDLSRKDTASLNNCSKACDARQAAQRTFSCRNPIHEIAVNRRVLCRILQEGWPAAVTAEVVRHAFVLLDVHRIGDANGHTANRVDEVSFRRRCCQARCANPACARLARARQSAFSSSATDCGRERATRPHRRTLEQAERVGHGLGRVILEFTGNHGRSSQRRVLLWLILVLRTATKQVLFAPNAGSCKK